MEGTERIKFGFFNDASNLSLSLSLRHSGFEFRGSFIIRNSKEITWTAIYFGGRNLEEGMWVGPVKKDSPEKILFLVEMANPKCPNLPSFQGMPGVQWKSSPSQSGIRTVGSWKFSLKKSTQRRSIDHMWLCHRKGRTKNLAMHDYMVRSLRWWNWTLRTYKWMSKYLHDPITKPRMPRDVKTMPVSCPKSIWEKHAPMCLTYQWSSEIEGLGTSDFETKHLKFEVFLSHFNKQWISICHSIDICNHEVYF